MIKNASHERPSTMLPVKRVRVGLCFATAVHTLLATWIFAACVTLSGWTWYAVLTIPLFALLFAQVAFSFWMSMLGFARRLLVPIKPQSGVTTLGPEVGAYRSNAKTAILIPVFNESPSDVLAGVMAMRQSLMNQKVSQCFEFFILSDTTDASIAAEEEKLWARSIDSNNETLSIFYRRRPENIGRKSGNLEDFCVRWGARYNYMIVLDADSLMSGPTLRAMVERMESQPHLGILQVPPVPINRQSLFARLQQFAASVYGPTFTEGLHAWAGSESNYWGHNAIIRVAPFMQHCGLPMLPGKAPLGGEILSHDFVEAALMLRANWGVELACDLGGSYEECPTNLLDFAIRDQRWCQGNLQHSRLVMSEGFHPTSRIHMALGVLSYLASPLWLVFMVVSLWILSHPSIAKETEPSASWWIDNGVALVFAMTLAMLLIPKFLGWIETICDPNRRHKQGGAMGLLVSVLLESLLGCLIAPTMMILQTRFVWNTLRGRRIAWNRQNRDDSQLSWSIAWKQFGFLSLLGLATSIFILSIENPKLWWFLPISVGWASAMPLAVWTSRSTVGRKFQDWHLLLIPEETDAPEVLRLKQSNREFLERRSVVKTHGWPAPIESPSMCETRNATVL